MIKVVHLTSVHQRFDTRIFLKECTSLVQAGYLVNIVVADGMGDEVKNGLEIFDVGLPKNRLDRLRRIAKRVYSRALRLDAEIYHLHDPELIPFGLMLKKRGKKVIFDSHEDVPKQLLSKYYLNATIRVALSKAFARFEKWACPKLDAVVAATPHINRKFQSIRCNSVEINNYPLLGELSPLEPDWSVKLGRVCYIGSISAIRGIDQVVDAMSFATTDVRLQLIGKFAGGWSEEARCQSRSGWDRVDYLGVLGRLEIKTVLERSVAGLVTFLPLPNHIDAQPNKMFEYMSAGIPVIASDFPLWKEIIEDNKCGLCVDPERPEEIAEAIDYLIANPNESEAMGRNGQTAVRNLFNWRIEEEKLLSLYRELSENCIASPELGNTCN